MAFTQAQLDAIEEGIATGSLRIEYEGRSISYRSLEDMMSIRAIIRRALGLDSTRSATVLVAHERGYGGTSNAANGDDVLTSGS